MKTMISVLRSFLLSVCCVATGAILALMLLSVVFWFNPIDIVQNTPAPFWRSMLLIVGVLFFMFFNHERLSQNENNA